MNVISMCGLSRKKYRAIIPLLGVRTVESDVCR
jgi:hypothetical protein